MIKGGETDLFNKRPQTKIVIFFIKVLEKGLLDSLFVIKVAQQVFVCSILFICSQSDKQGIKSQFSNST